MPTVHFDTLKRNIAYKVCTNTTFHLYTYASLLFVEHAKHNNLKELVKYSGNRNNAASGAMQCLLDQLKSAIMSTDIRCIDHLTTCFAELIPQKWIVRGQYTTEYTDNGFILIKNE